MNKLWGIAIAVLLLCSVLVPGYTQDKGYFSLVDESGSVVYITGWKVRVGDQCIAENNKRYEVVSVEGEIANVKLIGEVNLSQYTPT